LYFALTNLNYVFDLNFIDILLRLFKEY
jgi:hypothetical protein